MSSFGVSGVDISRSARFATDIIIIDTCMLQWHHLAPLQFTCICREVNSQELITFSAETHSSHPRPWPHSGTGVSSSSDD